MAKAHLTDNRTGRNRPPAAIPTYPIDERARRERANREARAQKARTLTKAKIAAGANRVIARFEKAGIDLTDW